MAILTTFEILLLDSNYNFSKRFFWNADYIRIRIRTYEIQRLQFTTPPA